MNRWTDGSKYVSLSSSQTEDDGPMKEGEKQRWIYECNDPSIIRDQTVETHVKRPRPRG